MAATTPSISRLDTIYRSILLSKFFVKGWGNPQNMKRIFKIRKIVSNRETCRKLVDPNHPIYIDRKIEENDSYRLYEGHFHSPFVNYLSEMIPIESHKAYFQLIVPSYWNNDRRCTKQIRPMCVQIAGTGDHNFWRRRQFMAKPLIRDYGIGSIILENPFYGLRKPKDQLRSQLNNVSDIFIMGGCLILESLALFHWCKRMNFSPLCVTGISMGGHNASLAATSWHEPIGVVPCLSWTTASCVFTQGVMSGSIPWKILESQYLSYPDQDRIELEELLNSPEKYLNDEMFDAGRNFAKNFQFNFNQFLSELNMSLSSYLEKIIKFKFSNNGDSDNQDDIQNNSTTNKQQSTNATTMNKKIQRDAAFFMRGIMDECTHLGNFSPLVDPELAIIINAKYDGYVPSQGVIPLTEIWKGSQVRYLDRGHISAILFDNDEFRRAIADSMQIYGRKYMNNDNIFEEHYRHMNTKTFEQQFVNDNDNTNV